MKKFLFLTIFIFYSSSSLAINFTYKTNSYKQASTQDQFLKFTGSSTKLGFITTSFDGFAREFQVDYELKNTATDNAINSLAITIPVQALDTDNSSRDEKLHDFCLNAKEFKHIKAQTTETISLQEVKNQQTTLALTIKDKILKIPALYSVIRMEKGFEISFSTEFSIKESSIPDPSIAIAKVKDLIKIEGRIKLQ